MNRFTHLTEAQVAEMQRAYERAQEAWDLLAKIDSAAIDMMPSASAPGWGGVEHTKLLDILDATHKLRDHLPVPAYLKPVKRWAGGTPAMDLWYWDRNSF